MVFSFVYLFIRVLLFQNLVDSLEHSQAAMAEDLANLSAQNKNTQERSRDNPTSEARVNRYDEYNTQPLFIN